MTVEEPNGFRYRHRQTGVGEIRPRLFFARHLVRRGLLALDTNRIDRTGQQDDWRGLAVPD